MAKVCVVYHSGYGHTKVQAEHVFKGIASVKGIDATLVTSEEAMANWDPLNAADCIVFGCPTYMGGMSAQFKTFVDAASKIWFKQGWKDKLAAGFTNSGSPSGDKLQTLMSLMINANQHSMIWISTGLLNDGEVNRLGSFGGAMAQSPQGAAAPEPQDLKTAELFGQRISEVTLRWVRGKA